MWYLKQESAKTFFNEFLTENVPFLIWKCFIYLFFMLKRMSENVFHCVSGFLTANPNVEEKFKFHLVLWWNVWNIKILGYKEKTFRKKRLIERLPKKTTNWICVYTSYTLRVNFDSFWTKVTFFQKNWITVSSQSQGY